jgi:cyclophilin family peptidyl-prolyl cis-trans isomerase/HEAT repeat protein
MMRPLRRTRLLALGIAAVGAAACAGTRLAPVSRLSPDDVALYARVLSAEDARRPDSATITAAIASGNPAVRRAGALAAGQLRMHAAAPVLRALLRDADTSVAARAAFSLGLLRDTTSIAALDSALSAAVPVAIQAAFALGEIGEPARATIVARAGAASPLVRAELLLASARLRPVPPGAAIAALDSDDPCVRWAAAYALSRPRVPAGIGPMLALSRQPALLVADGAVHAAPDAYECSPSETRAQIARALVRAATGDSLAAPAVAALRILAVDAAPHVRINALRSLASFGDSAVAPIIAATRDRDANVRVAAAQSLAGRKLARDLWTSLWNADTSTMFRRSLLESATHSGVVLPAHDEWRTAGDWHLRAALADAAALAPSPARGIAIATPLLADPDPRVRQSAVAAVAAYLDSAGGTARRPTILAALRDPDFFVRATAILALADSARAAEIPAILGSYALAARDSGNDARIAAIRYIANAWKRDSGAVADPVRAALTALPASSDPLVRAEARGVTPLAAWPGTEGVPRDIAWYERAVRDVVAPTLAGAPLRGRIESARGPITLELLGEDAPLTVANFVALARQGFYHNVHFHRVVPNFVAQDGDPRGDGNGGPGYAIRDELNTRRYRRGAVGMALSGPDTGGSQYFLTLSPQPHLDARYTIFATVVGGWDAMDRLVQGDAISNIVVP